ncbi:hypothetical protein E4U40_004178 [Claviceps sp. LM458 group G5]|nr:hypothetical protein E4U40_004178 [Claviceps sp. LM458 group G5]
MSHRKYIMIHSSYLATHRFDGSKQKTTKQQRSDLECKGVFESDLNQYRIELQNIYTSEQSFEPVSSIAVVNPLEGAALRSHPSDEHPRSESEF